MQHDYLHLKGKHFAFVIAVFCLTACSSTSKPELTEEEKQEVIELEESARKIDLAVDELDSAMRDLDEVDELLK